MFKRPHYIAFALVFLLVLIFLNLPGKTAQQFKSAIGELFLPLFGLSGASRTVLGRAGDAIVPRSELLREISSLKNEKRELELQISQMSPTWQENQRFRQLLRFQQKTPFRIRAARVVGRDPANWWRGLTINLGSRDGVSENFAVLSADGSLVGRVSGVSFAHADVVLLGDPNCKVAALVRETRDQGMIVPRSPAPLDATVAYLRYLPRHAELKEGLTVLTSGQGGVFPPDIPIGKITDFEKIDGLYTEARVRLDADLNRLEEVWVKYP